MRIWTVLVLRATLAVVLLASALGEWGLFRPAPVAAAVDPMASRFGLVANIGTRHPCDGKQGTAVNNLSQTGAKWAKEEFRWDWVEPSRGQWTWTCMDRAVNDERARGMEILGQLLYTPGWAVGSGERIVYTPPPLDLWSNYVAQTVARYKDRVHAWEVWNEPNEPVFWKGTREQYAELLAVTYDTIKRVDPSARVLGPAITGIDEDWLNAMPWDKFDVLGIHIYVPPAFLNDQGYSYFTQGLPNLKRIVDGRGRKPVWVTEFGFSSQAGGSAWHVGDENLQARYLVQQMTETLAYTGLNIEHLFPYDFNDDTPGGGFGLTRHDWASRKPAFGAYRTTVDRLDGATGRGKINAGPGVLAFRFVRDGKRIDVAWAPNGGTAVIPALGDGEVYTLQGARSAVQRTGNALQVAVGADPVYIVHPAPPPSTQVQRFSQRQQQTFLLNANSHARNSVALLALYRRCGRACPELRPLLLQGGASQAILAARFNRLGGFAPNGFGAGLRIFANDLDPGDYTAVYAPVFPDMADLSMGQGLTQGEVEAGNAYLDNEAQQLGYSAAVDVSLARAEAAHEAGNAEWEARQLQAAQEYAVQEAAALNAAPPLLSNMERAFTDGGDTQSLSMGDVADYQAEIDSGGAVATDLSRAMGDLGAGATLQAEALQLLDSQDNGAVAALGGGSFPRLMNDPAVTGPPAQAVAAFNEFAVSQCFPTTGFCVSQRFAAYWNANGGLAIYGFPISEIFEETLEDGRTYEVQYFERARFEHHPENAPPYDVLLGQFGRRIHPVYPGVGPLVGGVYFPETGHNITGAFRAYWEANGGLAQFGYPITEELTEVLEDGKPYTVQYFERARFEHHPENNPPYDVLLGQFGRRIYGELVR